MSTADLATAAIRLSVVGYARAMPTRPCWHLLYEADQSLTRDMARDREFETLGLGAGFDGDERESRTGAGETRSARDVGGSRCEESRSNDKSRRVSTAACWFTLRSVWYEVRRLQLRGRDMRLGLAGYGGQRGVWGLVVFWSARWTLVITRLCRDDTALTGSPFQGLLGSSSSSR
jgi:hypothetical protein